MAKSSPCLRVQRVRTTPQRCAVLAVENAPTRTTRVNERAALKEQTRVYGWGGGRRLEHRGGENDR